MRATSAPCLDLFVPRRAHLLGVASNTADNATHGVVINPGVGSPNLLLFMAMIPV